jgi:hypothetical protein
MAPSFSGAVNVKTNIGGFAKRSSCSMNDTMGIQFMISMKEGEWVVVEDGLCNM